MRREAAPPLPTWLADEVPYERYVVPVGDQRVHIMETGTGRPVVMVHGNPTWGYLYRHIVADLAETAGIRCIMPDLVGLGFSSKPGRPGAHTLEAHGRWLRGALEALDLEDVVLVGQDWGGPTGVLACAGSSQIRIAGMVLLNTVVGPPRPGFKPTLFHRLSQAPVASDLLFRGLQFPQVALWAAQGDKGTMRGRVARAYRYPLRRLRDRAAPLGMARMVPDSPQHPSIAPLERCRAFIEGFEGPVEVVWGRKDPILGSVGRYVEKLLPKAHVTWTDAGHFLQEEVPELIADAIRRVLDAILTMEKSV